MSGKSFRREDYYIEGLNEVLRAFKNLDKEATIEMRQASNKIAADYMVPAWKNAAKTVPKKWGQLLADSVRVKKDRIPSVSIGYQKKIMSGGASTNMIRYATSSGEKGNSFAPFEKTNWLSKPRKVYGPSALIEWGHALDRVITKWDTGV